jgi:hypothetical protein
MTRRIAEALSEPWEHDFQHFGVNGSGTVIIEVDKRHNGGVKGKNKGKKY